MTKVDIFKGIIDKAKSGGYTGPDYNYELGFIVSGTNIYSLIFREDFAKALWGEKPFKRYNSKISIWEIVGQQTPNWKRALRLLIDAEDKWKFLEENSL